MDIPLNKLLFPSDDPLRDFDLSNADQLGALREVALEHDVKAVFVDSLRYALKGDENSSEIAGPLGNLMKLARELDKPALLSHHVRKRGQRDPSELDIDRIRGSSAIVQAARMVWGIETPDAGRPGIRRLRVLKSNLAALPEPVGMEITDDGIRFGDAPNLPVRSSRLDDAMTFLVTQLSQGPVPSQEIFKAGDAAGHSNSTLRRAAVAVGVMKPKSGNEWYWELPTK